jgi:glycerate kinase
MPQARARQPVAVCCPDKFRGSLSASAAARAMADGLREVGLEARELPLADGGEGTLEVLLAARCGELRVSRVTGPLGGPVDAEWGLLADGTAVIELARASGLVLAGPVNDAPSATTRGTGELILAAVAAGARRAIVSLGGSATTDGGLGAVEALGWSLHGLEVTVACDVRTGFCDAAAVFGPQKGATPDEVEFLTERLHRLSALYLERTGVDVSALVGAGAAGGTAGGLAALGAGLRSGFAVVADAVSLHDALAGAELVVTGEGKLDASSLAGKVVGEVLRRAPAGARRAVIAGQVLLGPEDELPPNVIVESLTSRAVSEEAAIHDAATLVRAAASDLGRRAALFRATADR